MYFVSPLMRLAWIVLFQMTLSFVLNYLLTNTEMFTWWDALHSLKCIGKKRSDVKKWVMAWITLVFSLKCKFALTCSHLLIVITSAILSMR